MVPFQFAWTPQRGSIIREELLTIVVQVQLLITVLSSRDIQPQASTGMSAIPGEQNGERQGIVESPPSKMNASSQVILPFL